MNTNQENAKQVIRQAMHQQRWSMRRWAKEKGYNPNTVIQTIRRYFNNQKALPTGAITLRILADLRADFGEAVPKHLSPTPGGSHK